MDLYLLLAPGSSMAFLSRRRLSFGFSGAGFLTCYHLGVAECLQSHGLLLKPGELPRASTPPLLTGVSGGALVATAVAVGIRSEDAMTATLAIARQARRVGGILDHLQPGFSLVDSVEEALVSLTKDIDEDYALRRMDNGRLLRIGLTDSQNFPHFRRNPAAYKYVDCYHNLGEIISACVLSSYIPGLTGPVLEQTLKRRGAVRRADRHMKEMVERGAVKNTDGKPAKDTRQSSRSFGSAFNFSARNTNNPQFWDGGLANVFPVINDDTCLVTPFAGHFRHQSISPSSSSALTKLTVNEYAELYVSPGNAKTIRCIAFSSSDQVLESWFGQGFNDATTYIHSNSLCMQHTVPKTQSSDANA